MQVTKANDKNHYNIAVDDEELQFLVEFAINNLLAMGASPFLEKEADTDSFTTTQSAGALQ